MLLVWCALAYAVVVPIAALLIARSTRIDLRREREQLRALAARLSRLEAAAAREDEPPPEAPIPSAPPQPSQLQAPPPLAPEPPRAAAPGMAPPRALPDPRRGSRATGGSLEYTIGARAYVWVGGVALALAGSFFVKYAVDHFHFGPALRCNLGALFGLTLIACAERFRRSSKSIAQSLSGAGVAVLYAALYGAVSLYGLIAPLVGLLLLAVTTGGAVALAYRHGIAVAILGMLGGYSMPGLLGTHELPAELRLTYLAALHGGLCIASARRRWNPIGVLSLGAAAIWAVIELQPRRGAFSDDTFVLFVLVVAATTCACGLAAVRRAPTPDLVPLPTETLLSAGLAALLVVAALERADYPPHLWWSAAAIGGGALLLARLRRDAAAIPWMTAAAGIGSLVAYALERRGAAAVSRLVAGGVLLYGIGGSLAAFGAPRPSNLAWVAASANAALLGVAWWTRAPAPWWMPWWAITLLCGALHAALARARLLRRAEPPSRAAAVPHVVGAAAAIGAAVAMGFDDEPVAVAFALLVPLLVAAARRFELPELRDVAALAAAIAFLRTLLWDNPAARLLRGEEPHWAWVGATVGVPIAAFVAAAFLIRDDDSRHPKRRYVLAACRLAVLLVGLACRYGKDGDGLARFDAIEAGLLTSAWLVLAIGFTEHVRRAPTLMPRIAGLGTAALAAGTLLVVHRAGASPFDARAGLGDTPFANPLLLQYALPAALLWILAQRWRAAAQSGAAAAAGGAATLLGWWWATVTTRHAFVGAPLGHAIPAGRELYAYSAVWIVYAILLLIAALRLRSLPLRGASAIVMLAAVLKVFLVDAAALRDLWRVASFLGLGIVLIVLARIYQRLDFGRRAPAPTTVAE